MNIKMLIYVLPMTLLFSAASYADLFNDGEKIEWSQVPPKVQQTIGEYLESSEIVKIEKETEEKKITVYEVKGKKPDGKEIEIKVEEDGTLFEFESDY